MFIQTETFSAEGIFFPFFKYLADARADAVMSFNENDLNSDGYYYINLKKKLKAGQLYEISVYHGRREITGNVDFFTSNKFKVIEYYRIFYPILLYSH